jgi:uncharacterized cupin superfamily protein
MLEERKHMPSVTIKHYLDIPAYEGPHAIEKIRFRSARPALGVSAWGMNILELEPGCETCPKHDHTADQQEEVYVVLEGKVDLLTPGDRQTLTRGMFARVAHDVTRQLVTTDSRAVVLALGGTPGKAYVSTGL